MRTKDAIMNKINKTESSSLKPLTKIIVKNIQVRKSPPNVGISLLEFQPVCKPMQ